VAATGCRSVTGKPFGQHVDDPITTVSVKSKLVAMRPANAIQVGVDTSHGVVYLSGTVPDGQHRTEAERIAQTKRGVHQVVNNIVVVPPVQRAALAPAAPSTESTAAPAASVTATPATGGARMSAVGEVTAIDSTAGHVTVRTGHAEYNVEIPGLTLQDLRQEIASSWT
jgi:hypothetical protein